MAERKYLKMFVMAPNRQIYLHQNIFIKKHPIKRTYNATKDIHIFISPLKPVARA
jgi:hypothetical protein